MWWYRHFSTTRELKRPFFDLALTGELRLFASEAVLDEYEATLNRPKFAISSERVQELMATLRTVAVIVAPGKTLSVSGDEPDNRFIECADAAQAEFLVTGNRRHFPAEWKTTRIVNSREFFDLIDLERIRFVKNPFPWSIFEHSSPVVVSQGHGGEQLLFLLSLREI